MATLYITDLDGTLLDNNATLSEESTDILKGLMEKGMQFTVATARSPATVVQLLKPLPMKLPVALMTGCILYDVNEERIISTMKIEKKAIDEICEMLEVSGQHAMVYTVQNGGLVVYYKSFTNELEKEFVTTRLNSPYKTFIQVDNYTHVTKNKDVIMFLFCVQDLRRAHTLYTLLSAVENTECYFYPYEYSNNGYLIEVYPKNCSKASLLDTLKKESNTDKIVSFGDNINDLAMFAASDVSCAVANACQEVKNAATNIIGKNTENSVAKWIADDFSNDN